MVQDDAALQAMLATNLDCYFGELVVVYQRRLYAFMVRQSGSTQDAEDIVQEALIQAYFALARYTPEQVQSLALGPWLYKIMLNGFYGRLRKNKVQSVPLDLAEDSFHTQIEDDSMGQPEVIVEGRESLRELASMVSELPEKYRAAVNLFYFEGLRYQEIADLLSIPMSSVKSHLHRGIRHLRKVMITQKERGK